MPHKVPVVGRDPASSLDGIVAASETMRQVCRRLEKVAPTGVNTLLLGESGTGKELMARALHDLSPRAGKPFFAINCAAFPENLLETGRLDFGNGAFADQPETIRGRVDLAGGGTLLLDEIGDLPLPLQVRLLRVLQEREGQRVGGPTGISADVCVVCTSNQDLQRAIAEQRFRGDLYHRISEVTISIPPLRERGEGRLVLARSVLARTARELRRPLRGFSEDAQVAIRNYPWPGNVRELENRIRTALIMGEGRQVSAADLDLGEYGGGPAVPQLREVRQRAESHAIREALAYTSGNISRASELLGIARPTLYNLLHKYDLDADVMARS